MRIYLKTKPVKVNIPFNHQRQLVGTINKWIGKFNEQHGKISLFSFSRLTGGKKGENGLAFQNGATFFFSAYNTELIKKIISGIQNDPVMFNELIIDEIAIQENPDFDQRDIFFNGSPILIKRREETNIKHITFKDEKASSFLEETLSLKMSQVGLTDDTLKIDFLKSHADSTTKLINYNGVFNRTSWCPVRITGKLETKQFAWNVGLGNSTGIGFGAII